VAIEHGSETGAPTDDPLAALWREHYRPLVRLARLLVDDHGTAEELVQDAFVRVASRLHRVPPAKAPAYLRSAVLNGARSSLRRRRVQQRHATEGPSLTAASSEHDALRHAHRQAVLDAVRTLPRRQRDVLLLRYFLDLSERDTADALGISPGSVKTHAHRGLAALAELLEDERWTTT
jgi:RNA polymerase sigma-70 factor (sigma-E family)